MCRYIYLALCAVAVGTTVYAFWDDVVLEQKHGHKSAPSLSAVVSRAKHSVARVQHFAHGLGEARDAWVDAPTPSPTPTSPTPAPPRRSSETHHHPKHAERDTRPEDTLA